MAKVLDDLSSEILCYLPVKSLLRFQSISKSWYSLIHSPRFIKSHLQQSPKINCNSVLLTRVKKKFGDSAEARLCVAGIGSPDKFLKNNSGVDNIQVYGSCNGLICFWSANDYIVLSNMSTKDFHITPFPTFCSMGWGGSKFYYGFGYDSVNDDYKVVIFVCNDLEVASPSPSCYAQTRIYGLRHNVWSESKVMSFGHSRKLCNQGLPAGFSANGVFAYGALHWVAQRSAYPVGIISSSISILAFDLAAEAIDEILLPEYLQNKTREKEFDIKVGVHGGSLCLSRKDGIDDHYDIWVLKDYKIKGSWTRLFRISTSMVTEDYMLQDFWTKLFPTSAMVDSKVTALTPVGSSGHELLLGKPLGGFYRYDLVKEELSYAGTCGCGFYEGVICVGTLVSISDYKAL